MKKICLIVLICVTLFSCVGCSLFSDEPTRAEKKAYEEGYSSGKKEGYEEGYDEGYREGSYADSLDDFSESNEDDFEDGYEKGYEDGVTDFQQILQSIHDDLITSEPPYSPYSAAGDFIDYSYGDISLSNADLLRITERLANFVSALEHYGLLNF